MTAAIVCSDLQFQLARRSVGAVRPDRVVRPGAYRADRGERLGQVHPAQAHRGGAAPRLRHGQDPRRGGLPAAGHHPGYPPERFRPARHHRRPGCAARHRGGRDGRGRLRGDRGRLGRRGARPRLAGPAWPRKPDPRRPGGTAVRRGDHPGRPAAPPALPGHPAAGRADQQPGRGRAQAAVRRGGVVGRGDGDRQPRPRAARPDGPVADLSGGEIRVYGGNLDAYEELLAAEQAAAERAVSSAAADVRREQRDLVEAQVKQARRDRMGRKVAASGGLPRIVAYARKRAAQETAGRSRGLHAGRLEAARRPGWRRPSRRSGTTRRSGSTCRARPSRPGAPC